MAKLDIGMALNYTNLYEINITPEKATPTWAWVAGGITNVDPAGNEESDQTAYYDGMGQASTDITGGQITIAFSGHRKYGDAAQDFVAELAYLYGESRKTDFRWTTPDGMVVEGKATVANIKGAGGDANSKGDFEFEIHFNGMPDVIPAPKDATLPESITAEAVSVAVGKTAEVGATVTPENSDQAIFYAVKNEEIATVTSDGVVTGVATGETELVLHAAAKPSVVHEVTVTVTD